MKLFAIYIGGTHEQALVELHDMRFVIAETIEGTYEQLRKSWWGVPKSLHIDSWGVLEYADGYHIEIKAEPAPVRVEKLYFINLGGYDLEQFTELHKNVFIVANGEAEAKEKAKKLITDWTLPHKDYLFDIENLVDINQVMGSETNSNDRWYVHLNPTQKSIPFKFSSDYLPLGKPK
jgi:hypothetical protein